VEEVGLDWTHPLETKNQHHMPSLDLEPKGQKEDKQTSQQLEA
jgi:hypothetical protein